MSRPARVERQLTAGKERLGGRRRDACRLRAVGSFTIALGEPGTAREPISNRWQLPCAVSRLTGAHGVRHDGEVARRGEDVRDALVRQWEAIAAAAATIDLETPSRVAGWRNREVVAHLSLQPALLRRFIATASTQHALVTVAASLAGTHSLARLVDASAREAAEAGRVDFAKAVGEAVPPLRVADLSATVVTMQGSIRLADYLVTRCVEAVVHGCDLVDPISPDRVAQAITAEALLEVLAVRAPDLVREARQLPLPVWIDVATGRRAGSGGLAAAVPVMT
jgi:Mycothiol maleylpyruvate isomerase N-terminal domain